MSHKELFTQIHPKLLFGSRLSDALEVAYLVGRVHFTYFYRVDVGKVQAVAALAAN